MTPPTELLLQEQSSSGAFRSFVHFGLRVEEDWNVFTTALVVRALARAAKSDHALIAARDRALDFLSASESAANPYSFGFWPMDARPPWVGDLPEDADDTSICALELLRHGRRDQDFAKRVACLALVRRRLESVEPPAPCWLRPGVFVTWLSAEPRPHTIDCCLNANVVAFLTAAGLRHLPGYTEACSMIDAAVSWAGDSWSRARSITPFYPHPGELFRAVEHAVESGAEELSQSLATLRTQAWNRKDEYAPEQPVCSNAYGPVYWTSPALQMARRCGEVK